MLNYLDNIKSSVISKRTTDTVKVLQNPFTKPWQDLPVTIIPSLEGVTPFLREGNPPTF